MMMKINIPCLLLLAFMLDSVSNCVSADETYICTHGQKERVISVIYEDQTSKLPCEVRHQKDGETKTLWHAKNQEGYCKQKALEFVQKQLDLGWRCTDIASGENTSTVMIQTQKYPPENIDNVKRNVAFAQALSVMSPVKMIVTEYYMSTGKYPDSIEAIGLKPEEMKTSMHINDLTIGSNGEIYAQGNEVMGLDKVIMLKPKQALGGISNEWECFTNLKTATVSQCKFDKNLVFPGINSSTDN